MKQLLTFPRLSSCEGEGLIVAATINHVQDWNSGRKDPEAREIQSSSCFRSDTPTYGVWRGRNPHRPSQSGVYHRAGSFFSCRRRHVCICPPPCWKTQEKNLHQFPFAFVGRTSIASSPLKQIQFILAGHKLFSMVQIACGGCPVSGKWILIVAKACFLFCLVF